jgi:prophage regulatory protein
VQFIRSRDVVTMIGVSRTTLWRMVKAGAFPAPVRITERSRGYLLETIEDWMRSRTDDSGGRRAGKVLKPTSWAGFRQTPPRSHDGH